MSTVPHTPPPRLPPPPSTASAVSYSPPPASQSTSSPSTSPFPQLSKPTKGAFDFNEFYKLLLIETPTPSSTAATAPSNKDPITSTKDSITPNSSTLPPPVSPFTNTINPSPSAPTISRTSSDPPSNIADSSATQPQDRITSPYPLQSPVSLPTPAPQAPVHPSSIRNTASSPPSAPASVPSVLRFSDLPLKQELMAGLTESGYIQCSPVQRDCLPRALEGESVVCKATPGVGKTLIFVVTVLQQLEDRPEIQAVVLANTPELVSQIHNEFNKVGAYLKHMRLLSCHEHSGMASARAANILIATPKKAANVVKKADLHRKCMFILDEADRLRYNEEEFQIREIFNMLPKQKQVILAATAYDNDTQAIFHKLVTNPCLWVAYKDETLMPPVLIHSYQLVKDVDDKSKKLLDILDNVEFNQMIIFVNHKHTATALVTYLRRREYNVIEMNGDRQFDDRMKDIVQFKKFKTRLMVSTDMLSRGIDIRHVNIVLNFDMAQRSDTYLRRVGRAARFGKKGLAISFLESNADVVMRKEVENRFNVKFKTLSLQIEPSAYMNPVNEKEL